MNARRQSDLSFVKGSPIDRIVSCAQSAALRVLSGRASKLNEEERGSLRRCGFALDGPTDNDSIRMELLPTQQCRELNRWLNIGDFRNALSAQSGHGGAFTIPSGFSPSFETGLANSPVRRFATVERIARGGEYHIPTGTDTAEGAILDDNATDPDILTNVITFGQLILRPRSYSSKKLLVPNELPEDSEVFAAMLGTMGGERIARKQNRDFTASLIAGATAVSAANAASLVSDDFANLIAGVGEQHLDGLDELVFMVSATSFGSILKLKDGSGNPLFVSGRVYGFRVVRNSHLAAPASGAVSVTFGRHQKFRIADVNTITVRRFGETAYAEKDEDLWEVVLRSDGALADCATVPVTKLVH